MATEISGIVQLAVAAGVVVGAVGIVVACYLLSELVEGMKAAAKMVADVAAKTEKVAEAADEVKATLQRVSVTTASKLEEVAAAAAAAAAAALAAASKAKDNDGLAPR